MDAGEVDRGAGELVLEAGLGQAPVAGSTQAASVHALGDGAFDFGAALVAFLPLFGLLERAGLLEFLVGLLLPASETGGLEWRPP